MVLLNYLEVYVVKEGVLENGQINELEENNDNRKYNFCGRV